MPLDYDTLIKPICDDIDTNYTGYKNYYINQMYLPIYWDKNAIVTVYAHIAESVIVYLNANHAGKRFLECNMKDGLIKYYNEDATNGLANPLNIKSACHLADWHTAVICSRTGDTTSDISDAASINENPDDHNGFFFIRMKAALGVQADYCRTARPLDGNYPTDWIQTTPNDATAIDLNNFDMLLIGVPDAQIFNDVNNFKSTTGYNGSILFYDVGFEGEDEESRRSLILSDMGLTWDDMKYKNDNCVLANLPAHDVVDLSGHTGYLIS